MLYTQRFARLRRNILRNLNVSNILQFSVQASALNVPHQIRNSSAKNEDEISDVRDVNSIKNLTEHVKGMLIEQGFSTLFPVQHSTLPELLDNKDLICRAKTGTGKTLAFVIPILQQLLEKSERAEPVNDKRPVAIIVTPTRELARQICGEFHKFRSGIRTAGVWGGVGFAMQAEHLRTSHVVVSTPGRLIDHVNRKTINLSDIRYFVIDEADRMLDDNFLIDIQTIMSNCPQTCQKMLWSATISDAVRDTASKFMPKAVFVDMLTSGEDEVVMPTTLSFTSYAADGSVPMLETALKSSSTSESATACPKTLIFANTKRETDYLSSLRLMGQTGLISAIHGDKDQRERDRALDGFRGNTTQVLAATDVAARGIDIKGVEAVIHCGIPSSIESFAHRSGRTGRAGKTGKVVTLYSSNSVGQFHRMIGLQREFGFNNTFKAVAPDSSCLTGSRDEFPCILASRTIHDMLSRHESAKVGGTSSGAYRHSTMKGRGTKQLVASVSAYLSTHCPAAFKFMSNKDNFAYFLKRRSGEMCVLLPMTSQAKLDCMSNKSSSGDQLKVDWPAEIEGMIEILHFGGGPGYDDDDSRAPKTGGEYWFKDISGRRFGGGGGYNGNRSSSPRRYDNSDQDDSSSSSHRFGGGSSSFSRGGGDRSDGQHDDRRGFRPRQGFADREEGGGGYRGNSSNRRPFSRDDGDSDGGGRRERFSDRGDRGHGESKRNSRFDEE